MRQLPLRLWAMAALSGILQVLPFPIAGPTPVWRTAFCWIAVLPLVWALLGNSKTGNPLTRLQGAILGYLCGFIWYLGNCYWIYQTMNLYGGLSKPVSAGILILFSLYLGLYHALFGTLVASFRRRFGRQTALLLVPFAWVAVELARARITGLPWDFLGIAQVDNPLLIHLAPITGAYGISFVIALVNALWLVRIRIRERRHTRLILTIAGVLIVLMYIGFLSRLREPASKPTATAILVQHNLSVGTETGNNTETTAQLMDSFSDLSLYSGHMVCDGIPELSATHCSPSDQQVHPDSFRILTPTNLIVWPESPANFHELDPAFHSSMSTLARASRSPLVIGDVGIDSDPSGKRRYFQYNSANVISADGVFLGRYDKMHLVPFGEYTPYKSLFFFAGDLLGEVGTFDRGTNQRVFTTGGHTYGTFICYESIFADEIRHLSEQGADVLVNISNDGWYGDTSAPWQHLNMVRMRAIENHRWILRATNTGVTVSINPAGQVVAAAPRHIRTSIRVPFGYEHNVTFYAAHGDLFAYLCAFVTAVGLAFSLQRRVAVN
jgi:apolipoprotein N-acyltransferase